mmetsp:Transcript_40605/g.117393  ORF Transcript_40605/g.117393 Transcript_40605/m.117393 type:complete len:169 (-) Transcript_40605:252-758(-)
MPSAVPDGAADASGRAAPPPPPPPPSGSLLRKVLFVHGLVDALMPNPLTAGPLLRVLDRNFPSKKKRGWAWLFLAFGLMKVHASLCTPQLAARLAGWAYFAQTVSMAAEGLYHRSIPRPDKVLVSYISFNVVAYLWLQVSALRASRHARMAAVQQSAAIGVPSAPPKE